MNTAYTVNYSKYALSKIMGVPVSIPLDETLNHALTAGGDYLGGVQDYTLNWFTMGSNDYTFNDAGTDVPMVGVPPRSTRMGVLYKHLPFRMVKQSDGLPATEVNQYALPVKLFHNDAWWLAYFAKRIDSIGDEVMSRQTLQQGDIVQQVGTIMSPIYPNNELGTDIVSVSRMLNLTISEDDVAHAKDYGERILEKTSIDPVKLCELGLCIGVEYTPDDIRNMVLVSSMNIGGINGIGASALNIEVGRGTNLVRL